MKQFVDLLEDKKEKNTGLLYYAPLCLEKKSLLTSNSPVPLLTRKENLRFILIYNYSVKLIIHMFVVIYLFIHQ